MEELVERVAAGESVAKQQVMDRFASADPTARTALLNSLAVPASAGSASCLETLLRLIDEHRLDRVPIRRILVDNDEVDDAHQDVLIAVARSIHRFRSESAFTTWLHTVARNTAVDLLRRRKDARRLHTGEEPLTEARRLSSLIAQRSELRGAVDSLPDHYRRIVVLRDVEQRSYREIAAELGLEMNTVKSRLSRGRALLAAQLDLNSGPVDG